MLSSYIDRFSICKIESQYVRINNEEDPNLRPLCGIYLLLGTTILFFLKF
jgi:hypothetical protein